MGTQGEENTPKQAGNPSTASAQKPQIFSLPAVDLANRDCKDYAYPARHVADYSMIRNLRTLWRELTTECFRFAGMFKGHPVQPHLSEQGHL